MYQPTYVLRNNKTMKVFFPSDKNSLKTRCVEKYNRKMSRNYHKPKVAATQFACVADMTVNIMEAEKLVRAAAADGANIVLLQELFKGLYFCQVLFFDIIL